MANNAGSCLSVAIGIIGLTTVSWAQERPEFGAGEADGRSEYQAGCAGCHGADGKGKGPLSDQLTIMPGDLTVLTKNNNGVFPDNAVYEIIDGREENNIAHGPRGMPVWGNRFKPGPDQAFYPFVEEVVRTRILAVIDYLKGIQEK